MSHICCLPFLLWPLMIHICCGLLSSTTPRSICIEPQKSLSSFAPQITLLWQEELKLCSGSRHPWDFQDKKHALTPSLWSPAAPLGDRNISPCRAEVLQLGKPDPLSNQSFSDPSKYCLFGIYGCKKMFFRALSTKIFPSTIVDFDSSHTRNMAKSQC